MKWAGVPMIFFLWSVKGKVFNGFSFINTAKPEFSSVSITIGGRGKKGGGFATVSSSYKVFQGCSKPEGETSPWLLLHGVSLLPKILATDSPYITNSSNNIQTTWNGHIFSNNFHWENNSVNVLQTVNYNWQFTGRNTMIRFKS